MKPIEPGCLALVIKGVHTGKTVRCQSSHVYGDRVIAPDGKEYLFQPLDEVGGATCWLVIGDLTALHVNRELVKGGKGWGFLPERALMRIDSEGDDELIDEFAMEECANHMLEQMNKEGVKRLW